MPASIDLRERAAIARCPYCHDALHDDDAHVALWECPECATLAHGDCARMHGGCTLLGCDGSFRPRPLPVVVAARARRSLFGRLVLAPIERDVAAIRRRDARTLQALLVVVAFAAFGLALLASAAATPTPWDERGHEVRDALCAYVAAAGIIGGLAAGAAAALWVFVEFVIGAVRFLGAYGPVNRAR